MAEAQQIIEPESELPEGEPTATPEDALPSWREDWRAQMAAQLGAEDSEEYAAEMKRLQRFADPTAVWKSYRSAEQKWSAKPSRTPPEDADELAEWRKDNGVPEAPDKYDLGLPEGTVLSAEDKPIVADFLKTAHAHGLSNEAAAAAVGWYMESQTAAAEAQAEADESDRTAVRDALRDEWGGEYKANMNDLRAYLGEEGMELLGGARLPDGRRLWNSPEAVKMFVAKALESKPTARLLPGGNSLSTQGAESRLAELDAAAKTPRTFTVEMRNEAIELRKFLVTAGNAKAPALF